MAPSADDGPAAAGASSSSRGPGADTQPDASERSPMSANFEREMISELEASLLRDDGMDPHAVGQSKDAEQDWRIHSNSRRIGASELTKPVKLNLT